MQFDTGETASSGICTMQVIPSELISLGDACIQEDKNTPKVWKKGNKGREDISSTSQVPATSQTGGEKMSIFDEQVHTLTWFDFFDF